MTDIDDLLERIDDPSLRAAVAEKFADATQGRKVGLVFEKHMPEAIALHSMPLRRGHWARRHDDERLLQVDRLKDGIATVTTSRMRGDDASWAPGQLDVPAGELAPVARFGDPIYPGLRPVDSIIGPGTDENAPAHVLLNAENHHALQALQWSHAGKVDLIYIDPPYNTGNKSWSYNDRYVAEKDTFRSSKWLSFMERRLLLAQKVLAPTGVIVVAIGDDEHHRLRMLMDQVFGGDNFIANIVWQGGGSSLSRFHAGGIDHMLVYARDMASLTEADVRWKVEKEGLQDVLDAAADAWEKSGHDAPSASKLLSSWWNRNKSRYDPGLGDNVKVDHNGQAVKVGDLGNSVHRPNLKYPITDPRTGKVYDPPENGWRFKREVMEELIANDSILFGTGARLKTPLRDMSMRSVMPSFYRDRRAAGQHLKKVLGTTDFPYPKDVDVLARWIGITTSRKRDAVVLDFFGGSGSTMEAVLRMNAEDGGTRQCILVTNNELAAKDSEQLRTQGRKPGDAEYEALGVFNLVTKPRISTVVTGVREDGSKYSEGLPGRVEAFELTYLDGERVRVGRAFEAVSPMLWLRAGARAAMIPKVDPQGWSIESSHAVLHDPLRADEFLAQLPDDVPTVYVVTDSESACHAVAARLPHGCTAVQLYERYITTFEITQGA